ncbi:MAG TPA: BatD family protein [Verrucomicrobiae bacterium]|jgi:hypothetical protein|nr:BatD family protein [Verrucomicrobiae bacterium]
MLFLDKGVGVVYVMLARSGRVGKALRGLTMSNKLRLAVLNMFPAQVARKGWLALALFIFASFGVAGAKGAGFTATVDRDAISMGESFTLTLKFDGGEPAASPPLPRIPNLTFSEPGRQVQQSYSFANGAAQSSVSVTYSYDLTPGKPGIYVIPALTVNLGGQSFTSQPIRLRVAEAGKGQASVGGAFLRLLVPKNEVYLGEVLPVDIQLFYRAIQGAEMPQVKEEGFTLGKMLQPTQASTAVNGQPYSVATMKTFVVPAKVGKLDLGPATMQVNVPKPNSRQTIFGQFYDWQSVTLESDPHSLQVLPLPSANVPAGFSGAVGNYSVTITASPTNVAMGDPITIKVQISGRGALESITLPAQTGWEQFKLYPPTSDFQPAANDPLGISGTRTFAITAVPQTMDAKEIPPYVFSYFDPDQKSYRTATQPAIPLIVRPSAASLPAPTASNPNNAPDNSTPAQDVSLIKSHLGTVAPISAPLVEQPWFLAAQAVPVFAWLAFLMRRKQVEHLANNPKLRREREVEQSVRLGLLELRRAANANDTEKFFAAVIRLLQERLGERLDLPATAITEAVLDEKLRPLKTPDAQMAVLRELFQLCNQARYGRQSTNAELVSLIPKVEAAMNDLKKIKA